MKNELLCTKGLNSSFELPYILIWPGLHLAFTGVKLNHNRTQLCSTPAIFGSASKAQSLKLGGKY